MLNTIVICSISQLTHILSKMLSRNFSNSLFAQFARQNGNVNVVQSFAIIFRNSTIIKRIIVILEGKATIELTLHTITKISILSIPSILGVSIFNLNCGALGLISCHSLQCLIQCRIVMESINVFLCASQSSFA